MRIDVAERGYTDAVHSLVNGNLTAADAARSLSGRLRGYAGMAGDDETAEEFAASYDEAATASIDALASVVGAFGTLAHLVEASLVNHGRAEERSTMPGRGWSAPVPSATAATNLCPLVLEPPSSLGSGDPGPGGPLGQVLDLLQDVFWPNADTDRLHEAARTWRTAAESLDVLADRCSAAVAALEDERSPEIPLATAAITDLRARTGELAHQLAALGTACAGYADHVEAKRAELRDLLEDLAVELGVTALLGGLLAVASAGSAAGAATTIGASRVATANGRFRSILDSLRLLAAGSALETRSAAVAAREIKAVNERVNGARVMLIDVGSQPSMGATTQSLLPHLLARSEGLDRGHTITRHVGKSIEFLHERVLAHRTARHASSFTDKRAAELFVNKLLRRNSDEIKAWLSGTKAEERFEATFDGMTTGISVNRAGDVLQVSGVRAILVRDPAMPQGFWVKTSFPQP